jgi:hypothetical protein
MDKRIIIAIVVLVVLFITTVPIIKLDEVVFNSETLEFEKKKHTLLQYLLK